VVDDPTSKPRQHILRRDPNGRAILDDLHAAGTQDEWNRELARLVSWLAALATPEGLTQHGDIVFAVRLAAFLERGFKPKPNRPSGKLRARKDAAALLGIGAGAANLRDAVSFLQMCARADGEKLTDAAARKRVEAAEREGGFRLPREPRFGKNPRPLDQ
jgi:hypothetical protein